MIYYETINGLQNKSWRKRLAIQRTHLIWSEFHVMQFHYFLFCFKNDSQHASKLIASRKSRNIADYNFYSNLISLLTCSVVLSLCSVLLMQAIAATTNLAPSTSSVIKNERYKKAVSVSQSPITYVKHLVEPGPDSKIIRPKRNKAKKVDKQKSLMSNHELLSSLGLGKLPSPSNHHRKRLATQSRHVGRPDDSKVFIVKLPPSPHYFSSSVNNPNSIDDRSKKVRWEVA